MDYKFYVVKASGEKELFSQKKYIRSLQKTGCSDEMVDLIMQEVVPTFEDGITTKEIYFRTWRFLKKQNQMCIAGRYNLKQAILKFGPSGYPFEHFVFSLFKKQGYKVKALEVVRGFCISHEVDVIAFNDKERILIECKFHNKQEYR